jgi:DNA invertase Pin-like site-specific DNA recombinase
VEAILYCRTSTDEQRNGTDAQRERLLEHARRRKWKPVVVEEHASGKTLARRPVLSEALDRLDCGEAAVLVVTKLDRLARSTGDFATIIERSQQRDWALVVLDFGGERLDTSTAMGKAMARMAMVFAELERDLISERTREAMAEVKRRGVQLGKPSTVPDSTRARIAALQAEGLGYRAIATRLNVEGVPAPSGDPKARWHATSVARHTP